MKSESIKTIVAALVDVQAQIKPVERDGNNPHFNHKFATLSGIWETVRPLLTANGLVVTQLITTLPDGSSGLETLLMHISGEWISGEMPLLLAKNDPQGQGSAVTYARRYALAALLGAVQEDDDGHQATQSRQSSQQVQQQQRVAAALAGSDKPSCPQCGMVESVIKNSYGGGDWVCYTKKKGCGAKFDGDAPSEVDTMSDEELPF